MISAVRIHQATKAFWETDHAQNGNYGFVHRLFGSNQRRVCAVDNVSLEVKEGEIFSILGPNGSGKSTLIRLIATLLLPDAGSIEVFGLDVVSRRTQVRRLINRVSVEAAFFKKLSARENLRYAGRLYGLSGREIDTKMRHILDQLGFPRNKHDVSLSDLSRGQQQKVAVARALLTSPALVLMDEPTTGLDPKSKREVQEFTLRIRRELNTTVLLTSHDMDEVQRLADRIAMISNGKIVGLGTPDELIARYGEQGREMRGGSGPVNLEDVFYALTGSEAQDEEAS